jgi:hypothetical protein
MKPHSFIHAHYPKNSRRLLREIVAHIGLVRVPPTCFPKRVSTGLPPIRVMPIVTTSRYPLRRYRWKLLSLAGYGFTTCIHTGSNTTRIAS